MIAHGPSSALRTAILLGGGLLLALAVSIESGRTTPVPRSVSTVASVKPLLACPRQASATDSSALPAPLAAALEPAIPPTEDAGRFPLPPRPRIEDPLPPNALPLKPRANVLVSVGLSHFAWDRRFRKSWLHPLIDFLAHGGSCGLALREVETEEEAAHEAIQDCINGLLREGGYEKLVVILYAVEPTTAGKLSNTDSYIYAGKRNRLEINPAGEPTSTGVNSIMATVELEAIYISGHGSEGGAALINDSRPDDWESWLHLPEVAAIRKQKKAIEHLFMHCCYSARYPNGQRFESVLHVLPGGTIGWDGIATSDGCLERQKAFVWGDKVALPSPPPPLGRRLREPSRPLYPSPLHR